jgi:hypothetical protein
MLANFISFGIENRFGVGVIIGAVGFGAPLFVIGWCKGHDGAMGKISSMPRPKLDETHGDVPELPPDRPRRFIPTEGRS